jgi:hypothetical protein
MWQKINFYTLIGCLGIWALLIYYFCKPDDYEHDIVLLQDKHRRSVMKLIYLFLHFVHTGYGKNIALILMFLLGLFFLFFSFKNVLINKSDR